MWIIFRPEMMMRIVLATSALLYGLAAPLAAKAATEGKAAPKKEALPSSGASLPATIQVQTPVRFQDLAKVYQSPSAAPHILVILHLPVQNRGQIFAEVFNNTKTELGTFQFTLEAYGHQGTVEFDDLPPTWSAVKALSINSLRELALRNPRAVDKDANEIGPKLFVHVIDQSRDKPRLGKRPPSAH